MPLEETEIGGRVSVTPTEAGVEATHNEPVTDVSGDTAETTGLNEND